MVCQRCTVFVFEYIAAYFSISYFILDDKVIKQILVIFFCRKQLLCTVWHIDDKIINFVTIKQFKFTKNGGRHLNKTNSFRNPSFYVKI